MTPERRIIIISNRLPVKISKKNDTIIYTASEGGLATGMGSVYQQGSNLWIGWPGAVVKEEDKPAVTAQLATQNLQPVFLTQDDINDYYEGFSNETIWPLFHYFPTYATYLPRHFDAYRSVNQKFADAITSVATNDDIIWIQDYQLMLLPEMVRRVLPDATIGFFMHIPFPSYEIFRLLPWRKELLQGMTGADIIGFHTYDDVRHFLSAANRIEQIQAEGNRLLCETHTTVIDAFPISIDYKKYHDLSEDNATRRVERKLKPLIHSGKHLLSIDRLDYSKGILHRLHAYEIFLERHPELHGKVTLMQLVVPSRDTVPKYSELKDEMNRLIGEINGRFGKLGWQPIQHFYRSFPLHLLSALYRLADVAIVTPMRDGMNLVCKEYIASKTDGKGVLILSEMAGAARELSEAIIVNPNDVWRVAEAIYEALIMPEAEQKLRMEAMQQTVSTFDIHNWVKNFMKKLADAKIEQLQMHSRTISDVRRRKIAARYRAAQKRLILLDYDGTLVPFHKLPSEAVPDAALLTLLEQLCHDPHNKVIIISGRDYETLDAWLGHLPLDMVAEHGAWYKEQGKEWRHRRDLSNQWKTDVRPIMDIFAGRTPGAFVEEKSYSLAWHYRRVENGLGQLRANELSADVSHFLTDRGLQLLMGDKVIEIKSTAVNKGKAVQRWLDKEEYNFILAIGDDHTDEDTFKAVPAESITIKVGSHLSAASYYLPDYKQVRILLEQLNAVSPATSTPPAGA